MHILGIDAGGTRTVCLLADASGVVRGEVRGPGANLQSEGTARVEAILGAMIEQLVPSGTRTDAVCVGMAGADRPAETETVREVLLRMLPGARVLVVNDALVALEAGRPGQAGVVVISGTGSIAYGRDDLGRAARAGGWGYVLGDEGSGYWLGRQTLRSVVRAADGRGQATALAAHVFAHYGVTRAQALVHEIAGQGSSPSAIARLARYVGLAAEAGDAVAQALIAEAATDLAAATRSVVDRLGVEEPAILLSGGTLKGVDQLRAEVVSLFARRMPGAVVSVLDVEPAVGALSLARADLAGKFVLPTYVEESA